MPEAGRILGLDLGDVRIGVAISDPERHLEGIKEFIDAGYDNVYFHQVGPHQEGFLQFAEAELLPRVK